MSPFEYKDKSYFNVSDGGLVALGYSVPAILALLATMSALALVPFVFSFIRLRGNMVAGGSDSLVISAACHCSLSPPTGSTSCVDEPEVQLDATSELSLEAADSNVAKTWLEHLPRSKLKWGAQPLPSHLEPVLGEGEQGVKHLGFGIQSTDINSPVEGEMYL
ncbi:hypothetical protein F4824DRAFT_478678 [Ustulina deusta]|nr:hypothetical protein F4824DRAFT_478678 [Ustulina deusta]